VKGGEEEGREEEEEEEEGAVITKFWAGREDGEENLTKEEREGERERRRKVRVTDDTEAEANTRSSELGKGVQLHSESADDRALISSAREQGQTSGACRRGSHSGPSFPRGADA